MARFIPVVRTFVRLSRVLQICTTRLSLATTSEDFLGQLALLTGYFLGEFTNRLVSISIRYSPAVAIIILISIMPPIILSSKTRPAYRAVERHKEATSHPVKSRTTGS